MPKRRIELVNEQVYHIYNRGFKKDRIFMGSCDYERFLWKLDEYKKKYNIQIIAWGLVPNHFHMLVRAIDGVVKGVRTPNQITSFFLKLQQSHAMYFKNKYEKIGPVFQGRFRAKLVKDEEYLIKLLHYIHSQPSHHKICSDWDWPYTSLYHYISMSPDSDLISVDDYHNSFRHFEGLLDYGLEFEESGLP